MYVTGIVLWQMERGLFSCLLLCNKPLPKLSGWKQQLFVSSWFCRAWLFFAPVVLAGAVKLRQEDPRWPHSHVWCLSWGGWNWWGLAEPFSLFHLPALCSFHMAYFSNKVAKLLYIVVSIQECKRGNCQSSVGVGLKIAQCHFHHLPLFTANTRPIQVQGNEKWAPPVDGLARSAGGHLCGHFTARQNVNKTKFFS